MQECRQQNLWVITNPPPKGGGFGTAVLRCRVVAGGRFSGLRCFFSRKDNEKYRSLRRTAADGNTAAQILRQLLDDGQAQTVALGGAAALITPVEAVEHMGQRLRRNK